jgi:signal peptidase I
VSALITDLSTALLTRAVRGRGERGTDWGEAMLRELAEVEGAWPSARWALSGAWAAWRDRLVRGSRPRPLADLSRPSRIALRAAVVLAAAAVTLGFLERYVATVRYEASPAMAPTVAVGDRVLVDRIGFHLTGLARGDVVVVTLPGPDAYPVLKRVIGLPGDRISCVDGHLVRNDEPVDEGYLEPGAATDCPPATVPDGTVYLLGDAREVSRDSRHYGAVPQAGVVGRVVLTLPSPLTNG